MIVGNGLIAKTFYPLDSEDLLIFASGVSDSTCIIKSEYDREKDLLIENINRNKGKKIVYFGTCDVYDDIKKTMYVNHKIEMEEIIKKNCDRWLIYRLPQVIGIGNRSNLLYFLVNNIMNGISFNCSLFLERNLVKKEDLLLLGRFYINTDNEIINLANPINIRVMDIINIIERITFKKAVFNIKDDKNKFKISLREDFPYHFFNENYYEDSIIYFINNFLKYN